MASRVFIALGVCSFVMLSHAIPVENASSTFPPFEINLSILVSKPISSPTVVQTPVVPISVSSIISTATTTEVLLSPTTVTVSEEPSTITDIVTVYLPAPTLTPTPTPTRTSSTTWSMPAQISDLSSFNVTSFPGTQKNLQIVKGIPASASTTAASPDETSGGLDLILESPTDWDNTSSVIQLFYPENSINPGQKPQGGAEFYATPLDLTDVQNVSMSYCTFFPGDFEFVLGGKLPGMYGGHTGCSGGNAALDCFSTRLMWRPEGVGELYLYAPKDKQTDSLCSNPQSVCDATYGLSLGRGSFSWKRGSWTCVRQTVALNTPGKQDGYFSLDVDDVRVIDRTDVYYRSVPTTPNGSPKSKGPKKQPDDDGDDDDGDLLGGLLGRRQQQQPFAVTIKPTLTVTKTVTSASHPSGIPIYEQKADTSKMVSLVGIFFSTFFGGHEPKYASPKDQMVWFKDFALNVNDK